MQGRLPSGMGDLGARSPRGLGDGVLLGLQPREPARHRLVAKAEVAAVQQRPAAACGRRRRSGAAVLESIVELSAVDDEELALWYAGSGMSNWSCS